MLQFGCMICNLIAYSSCSHHLVHFFRLDLIVYRHWPNLNLNLIEHQELSFQRLQHWCDKHVSSFWGFGCAKIQACGAIRHVGAVAC